RADYDQLKSMIILEGTATQFAELHFQEYVGAVPSSWQYRKIIYNLKTEEVKVKGFGGGALHLID
ncbi:MAG: hypothetical protein IH831_05665, partial [Planctomycetes bacterium]|nr:hypothetical protein [Planctomycetota bacterium]